MRLLIIAKMYAKSVLLFTKSFTRKLGNKISQFLLITVRKAGPVQCALTWDTDAGKTSILGKISFIDYNIRLTFSLNCLNKTRTKFKIWWI